MREMARPFAVLPASPRPPHSVGRTLCYRKAAPVSGTVLSRAGVMATVLAVLACGCTVGEGEGEVRSEKLYVEDCWNGPFDLNPTFFGANPYRRDVLLIRVQRGDNIEEVSDGLTVLVNEVRTIRQEMLGQPLPVGLPPGVRPVGAEPTDREPTWVSLALYLHDTCHRQNGVVFSVEGQMIFHSLFSGDPNESSGDDRLTDAEFSATFADPRQGGAADQASLVTGHFRFFFQRGQPAQPFP